MSRTRRLLSSTLVGALLVAAPIAARAEGAPAAVVAIDTGELVVDVGAARGVHEGDLVELWRPLRLRHPVTGQMLVDRFRIGTLRLTQVRSALSLAVVEGPLSRPPAIGDVVILDKSTAPAPAAPPPPIATATPSAPANASSPAPTAAVACVEATPPPRETRSTVKHYAWSAPKLERVRAGEPQSFAVELDPQMVGAVVHVRKKGAAAYRSVPMASVGPRYWAATLPGDAMTDGGMEYFVEGVPKEAPVVPLIGSAEKPRSVEVDEVPASAKPPGTLAQVTLQSEYASFNAKRMNDFVWQTEGSVGWRLHDEGIRAVRSGFGVLRGEGGSLKDLDTLNKEPTAVGLTYGYVEAEVTMTSSYALIVRPILGLRDNGITGGAQGFVRIGNDLRTNLAIGGEVLGSIGQRGIVQLEWRTIPRVPIVLRTEVTTQPASSGDVGARAIAQVGYQLTNELVLAARGSYQGRTINHAGPGAGLAMSYQW